MEANRFYFYIALYRLYEVGSVSANTTYVLVASELKFCNFIGQEHFLIECTCSWNVTETEACTFDSAIKVVFKIIVLLIKSSGIR